MSCEPEPTSFRHADGCHLRGRPSLSRPSLHGSRSKGITFTLHATCLEGEEIHGNDIILPRLPKPFRLLEVRACRDPIAGFGSLSPRLAKTRCQAAEQLPPLATKCLASLPRPPMRQISASSTQRRTMHPPRRAFPRTQTVWPKPGMLAVSHISGIGLGVLYPSCRTASGLTAR